MNIPVRNSDPSTSHESAEAVGNLAAKLRSRILALARLAGPRGITISEAAEQIPEHKNTSVSPRFSELVARGALVRSLKGYGKPTKRSPAGVPQYETRFDPRTERNVIIHWLPGFVRRPPQGTR
jgi:hypothetical protein